MLGFDIAYGRSNHFTDTLMQGILNEAWKHKLIFVETPDAAETTLALDNYRKVLDCLALPCFCNTHR